LVERSCWGLTYAKILYPKKLKLPAQKYSATFKAYLFSQKETFMKTKKGTPFESFVSVHE
jgi:hypothetical protein